MILIINPPVGAITFRQTRVHRSSDGVQGVQVHPLRATKKLFLGIFVGMRQNGAEFGEVHPRV